MSPAAHTIAIQGNAVYVCRVIFKKRWGKGQFVANVTKVASEFNKGINSLHHASLLYWICRVGLRPLQVSGLKPVQVSRLKLIQVSGLKSLQIPRLKLLQVSGLKPDPVFRLKPLQISRLKSLHVPRLKLLQISIKD